MSVWMEAFSAALIDFLWQGALVGAVVWLTLAAMRQRSPNARYAACCAALTGLSLLPVLTAAAIWTAWTTPTTATATAAMSDGAAIPQTLLQIWFVPESPRIVWLEVVQGWALPLWFIGVLLFSIRLCWACGHAFRLRRRSTMADTELQASVSALAGRIGVKGSVRVLVSSIVQGPGVVGWLRPAILLPGATAMGLTPLQLEAVLAHELAHIRRHDYPVNVLQVVAETLFFYHPIVWWMSRRIRIERELCCDDVAVSASGDAVSYARALTTLARLQLRPELAVAATGGSLKFRVQRLLGAAPREFEPSGAPGAIVLALAAAVVVLNIDRLQALTQSGNADQPRFEVASVKVNKANDNIVFVQGANGKYTAIGHSLAMLIQSAYRVQQFQVIGGPEWIDTVRFDIQATEPPQALSADAPGPVAPGPGEPTRQQLMLRSLLEDRFRLAIHKDTRERPVYALIPARSDGRLGAQLQRSTTDCVATRSCGTSVGPGYIRVRGVTMPQFATAFSRLSYTGSSLNRLVVDRSGLEGTFDAEVRFTPENNPAGLGPFPGGVPAIDPNGPSIFTAVQEQLGLKLDAQRGPVEVLVIDRAAHPTEN